MEISVFNLVVIISGAVVLTGLLMYLWWMNRYVSAKKYQLLDSDFQKTRNDLQVRQIHFDRITEEYTEIKEKFALLDQERNLIQKEAIGLKERLELLSNNYHVEKELNATQKKEIEQNTTRIIDLNEQLSLSKAELQHFGERMKSQKEDFEKIRDKSLLEFKAAADSLLEEKSTRFATMNKDNIEQILKPLGDNLDSFKKKVEETYDKESKQRFSLEDKIKELVRLNNQISQEATNLTNALKGQSKTQGDWGEMILENILEYSGLTKNREYFVQDTFRDEDGNLKKPDIIVKYPDQRFVIIDSKVSLNAYERLSKTEDRDLMELEMTNHIRSIKNHIDDLSSKEYDKFDKSLDFVMLFVPIEPAYMVAMQRDPELWNYAYTKRILLISPTNLIAALKMVSDIWKRDDQNQNAREIAKRGETLYDKFVSFVGDLENIEKHISKADESWKDAMSKLKSGRGNLIGQAEKLKKLGLKPKKQLPDTLLLDSEEEE